MPTKYPGVTFATFGGNPVSCAAAHATIEVIENENLVKNCAVVGKHLGEQFKELKEKHQLVGDARGSGSCRRWNWSRIARPRSPMPHRPRKVFEECKKRGVLIGKGGVWGNVIRTGLMLNSSKAEADEMVDALDAGLTAAASG